MLYPFIDAYLKATGKSKTHIFAKIAPFSLKSDNYSKVYIIEPTFSDKVLSQYHLYNSAALAKFIETVGGNETKEVLFVTDRDISTANTLKRDFDRDARAISGLLSDNIICKYYFNSGVFLYNRNNGFFEFPSQDSEVSFRYRNSIHILETLKRELNEASDMRVLENVI